MVSHLPSEPEARSQIQTTNSIQPKGRGGLKGKLQEQPDQFWKTVAFKSLLENDDLWVAWDPLAIET